MELMAMIWLALLVVFLILEAATVQLISIWFAAGSLAAMLVSLLGGAVWLQVLVFFTVSIVLFALLWPMARKHLKSKVVATNADALVGKICKVTEPIDPLEGGRVKVGDVTWRAVCDGPEEIPAGTLVEIRKIQGAKVEVSPVKKEVEV